MDYTSLNSTTTQSRVYSNRLCGNCEFNDGMCYTSNPPKRKCAITGEFHLYDDPCNVPIDKLPLKSDLKSKYMNEIASLTSENKKESITVKGFNSLINLIKILVENDYDISIKKSGRNKYNETTLIVVEYEPKSVTNLVYGNNTITNDEINRESIVGILDGVTVATPNIADKITFTVEG